MPPKGPRRAIDTGIYVDAIGCSVYAKVKGVQRERRFPKDTSLAVLRRERRRLVRELGGTFRHKGMTCRIGLREAWIYFVADGDAIKIGRADDVAKRICGIQTNNPRPVLVLFTVRAEVYREREIHRRFSHLRIAPDREWFRGEPELIDFIERLKSGTDLADLLNPS